jgi:chorismate synthase
VTRPRPGHADLAGVAKYERADVRDVLERASARETAARVAAGAIARQLLQHAGIRITSHVFEIGGARLPEARVVTFDEAAALAGDDPVRCVDPVAAQAMTAAIDRAREAGDTVGGAFEVVTDGVPPGLGSYTQWDRKLDGRFAQALMSIPAIKAVGIGLGPGVAGARAPRARRDRAGRRGAPYPASRAADQPRRGLEGGVTNGETVRVSAWMKPIATLMTPLRSSI